MARTYKLRKFRNGQTKDGTDFINYSVTLPTPIAEALIEQFPDGFEFEIESTADGIVYRPVEPRDPADTVIPTKLGKRSTNGDAPAKPAARAKPGPKPKAKPGPKPAAKAAPKPKAKAAPRGAAKAAPKATVRKPAAAKAKPAAPKPRAPRPKAKA